MNNTVVLTLSFLFVAASCNYDYEDIFAYGNFEAEEIIISSENTGKIIRQNLEEGMELRQDDPVLIIDTIHFHLNREKILAAIQSVKYNIEIAEKEITVSKINISNLEIEQRRIASLFQKGAATEKQLTDMTGQLQLLKAKQDVLYASKIAAKSEITSLNIQIKEIEEQLKRCYILSPIDGVVLNKYVNQGELAVQGRALFRMANLEDIILRVFVSGLQLSEIKPGDSVHVNVDSYSSGIKTYTGIISWISDQSEFTPKIIQTRDERVNLVYPVKIIVKNDGYLKIGMPADISLVKP